MTKVLIFLILLATIIAIFFMGQAKNAAKESSPGLIDGKLPLCGSKPNCVNSTAASDSGHYIKPLNTANLTTKDLQSAVESTGGVLVSIEDNLVTAIYQSAIFGFIDDVLLQINDEQIDVRSSSRVGYSDFSANRKRVERLRQILNP